MSKKLDPKVAEKVMLKAGLKPLEPYKNSKAPWKSKCLKCLEIVFPKFSNIRQGDGGCRNCGYASVAKKLVNSPKDLKKLMQEKRLKPLEPYVNSRTKWRCRCLNCGSVVNPTYSDLKQGSGGCRNCTLNSRILPSKILETRLKKLDLELKDKYINSRVELEVNCLICKSSFKLRLSQLRNKSKQCLNCFVNEKNLQAIQTMQKSGLEPLTNYTRADAKWRCKCQRCNKIVFPTLSHIKMGQLGCKSCAYEIRTTNFRFPEKLAIDIMKNAGWTTIDPFENQKIGWKSKCDTCNKISYPNLTYVKRSKDSGCKNCDVLRRAEEYRLPRKVAMNVMKQAKIQPLEPYVNSRSKWKCKCLKCEKIIFTTLGQVRRGSGCRYCRKFSIDFNSPSYVYLITNSLLNSHKIGIANIKTSNRTDRLELFKKQGWSVFKVWGSLLGDEAYEIEAETFRILRKELKIPVHLSREDMPKTRGETETMSADSITLLELEKIIKKVIKNNSAKVKS
jgi:hypothetical protein